MASFNKVILMGNLTRDPEVRYTPGGTAVSEIGLAVNDRRKDAKGDWVDEVTFVDITLWGRQAEIAGEYLNKGSQILVEGRLKLDSWEKDGQKRSKLRVVGENMRMLGGKGGGGKGGSGPGPDESEFGGDEGPPPSASSGSSSSRPPAGRGNAGGGNAGGGQRRPPVDDGDIPF
ncbi:MAG: single-stranded DNA-binding protein [Planctomycetia bacterium]|nr:single-stranded DNA-binding protein [Planctomycetia bacterium]